MAVDMAELLTGNGNGQGSPQEVDASPSYFPTKSTRSGGRDTQKFGG